MGAGNYGQWLSDDGIIEGPFSSTAMMLEGDQMVYEWLQDGMMGQIGVAVSGVVHNVTPEFEIDSHVGIIPCFDDESNLHNQEELGEISKAEMRKLSEVFGDRTIAWEEVDIGDVTRQCLSAAYPEAGIELER